MACRKICISIIPASGPPKGITAAGGAKLAGRTLLLAFSARTSAFTLPAHAFGELLRSLAQGLNGAALRFHRGAVAARALTERVFGRDHCIFCLFEITARGVFEAALQIFNPA